MAVNVAQKKSDVANTAKQRNDAAAKTFNNALVKRGETARLLAAQTSKSNSGQSLIRWIRSLNQLNDQLATDLLGKQISLDTNRQNNQATTQLAFDEGIIRGEVATAAAHRGLDTQFRQEGIYVTSEQDIRDQFLNYCVFSRT